MKRKEFETIRKMLVAMIQELTSKALSLSEIRGIHLNLPDPSDVASLTSHRDFSLIVKERERELLERLREALEQIDGGSYGICEDCGEAIAPKRLMARPTTSLCVECQSRKEVHERRLRAASY